MKKTQKLFKAAVLALLGLIAVEQYYQKEKVDLVYEESRQSIDSSLSPDRNLRRDLDEIKAELRELSFNTRMSVDTSVLASADQTVQQALALPELGSVGFENGRLVVTIGDEIKKNDILFGVSLRSGRAIANHGMRTASSYNGELAHPLADQFVLILYRFQTYKVEGRSISGATPAKRWVCNLTPVDRQH